MKKRWFKSSIKQKKQEQVSTNAKTNKLGSDFNLTGIIFNHTVIGSKKET